MPGLLIFPFFDTWGPSIRHVTKRASLALNGYSDGRSCDQSGSPKSKGYAADMTLPKSGKRSRSGQTEGQVREDTVLIKAVRAGDREALGTLYAMYREDALVFAQKLVGSHHDAEDIMHEAFTKTISAIYNGFGPSESFRAYLYAAIKSAASGCWQRNLRELPADMVLQGAAVLDDRLENVLGTPEADRILIALKSLNGRWQKVLWYADVLQEPPRRIAPLMGIAPNAVSALILRARKALQVAYAKTGTVIENPGEENSGADKG